MNLGGSPSSRPEGSVVGRNIRLKGEISGNEDLYLDGVLDGSVLAPGQVVTIGPNAQIKATILARQVVVQGKMQGRIEASERICITGSGSMTGEIATPVISIEEGAWFYGSVDTRSRTGQAALAQAAR